MLLPYVERAIVDRRKLEAYCLSLTPPRGRYKARVLKPEIAINGWGRVKRRLDAASGVQDWRIHDLRRTVASGLAKQGFEPFIVERVLNHATTAAGPLAKVYQRYDYDKEKRQALDAWSRHVVGLLDPLSNNILPLGRADLSLPG